MPTPTLFTIRSEDLERLDAGEAVDFFRELLWAEARTIGLPSSSVRVSKLINVSDGGIDATVEGTLHESVDLIKQGRTGYQIKTSSAFRPWQQSAIKNELFGERLDPTRENLASGVRDCLDEGGTYVYLGLFQPSPPLGPATGAVPREAGHLAGRSGASTAAVHCAR